MKYLPSSQKKMKQFRADNRPDYCPISGCLMTQPVIDHCHSSGIIRGIIDGEVNVAEGKLFRAYARLSPRIKENITYKEFARGLADYIDNPPLEKEQIIHPKGLKQILSKFKAKEVAEQKHILKMSGISREKIKESKNLVDRVALFREHLTEHSL